MSDFFEELMGVLKEGAENERFEQERLQKVRRLILDRLPHEPQISPQVNINPIPKLIERRRFAPHYVYNLRNIWPQPVFEPMMRVAAGIALLLLGMWAGQFKPEVAKDVMQTVSIEQQETVIAMASPWEGWIEEGE